MTYLKESSENKVGYRICPICEFKIRFRGFIYTNIPNTLYFVDINGKMYLTIKKFKECYYNWRTKDFCIPCCYCYNIIESILKMKELYVLTGEPTKNKRKIIYDKNIEETTARNLIQHNINPDNKKNLLVLVSRIKQNLVKFSIIK